MRDEVFVLSL